jgi:hypothetical protein
MPKCFDLIAFSEPVTWGNYGRDRGTFLGDEKNGRNIGGKREDCFPKELFGSFSIFVG